MLYIPLLIVYMLQSNYNCEACIKHQQPSVMMMMSTYLASRLRRQAGTQNNQVYCHTTGMYMCRMLWSIHTSHDTTMSSIYTVIRQLYICDIAACFHQMTRRRTTYTQDIWWRWTIHGHSGQWLMDGIYGACLPTWVSDGGQFSNNRTK